MEYIRNYSIAINDVKHATHNEYKCKKLNVRRGNETDRRTSKRTNTETDGGRHRRSAVSIERRTASVLLARERDEASTDACPAFLLNTCISHQPPAIQVCLSFGRCFCLANTIIQSAEFVRRFDSFKFASRERKREREREIGNFYGNLSIEKNH